MALDGEARSGCANFVSDNTAGVMPEVWQALTDATTGSAAAYGNDAWTKKLKSVFTQVRWHATSALLVLPPVPSSPQQIIVCPV